MGGTAVPNGKYKFQAALLALSFGSNDFERQYCGGSLITPFEVLTVAHCVELVGDEPGQLPVSDLRVVVGRTVLTSTQGQKRRSRPSASTRVGPGDLQLRRRRRPPGLPDQRHPAGPGGGGVRPASPAGASAAARPASPGSTPASATGGGELHPLGHRGGAGELDTSRITSPTWASSRRAGRPDAGSPRRC